MEECMNLTGLEISLVSMYAVFDGNKNKNGKMDKDTFLRVLKEELPFFAQAAAKNNCDMFSKVDLDNDGFVDFEEFSKMVCSCACSSHDALEEAHKKHEQEKE
ncbi:hypothetical protein KUCAC02_011203 [Chaenocephalus aceratus]|uniref:Uncharacterized protein n=2 Tax=Chaenocephalus aceratus TaxID=36190 RepID=A0ACB9WWX4_CHAAC|nr:hypothetical protein KUCAC02_011203 [Chaenocephalus aceratus]KAI4817830.1 hypothetical protein KUCAC02_011203 [Chaenocephalus aceratus]